MSFDAFSLLNASSAMHYYVLWHIPLNIGLSYFPVGDRLFLCFLAGNRLFSVSPNVVCQGTASPSVDGLKSLWPIQSQKDVEGEGYFRVTI